VQNRKRYLLVPCAAIFLLAGPPVSADRSGANVAIAEARASIRAAERGGAGRRASITLKAARDNLSKAQVDADNRRWDDAERAATRALRDAELADAKARALRAQETLAELQAAVDTLERELNRMGGAQ